MKNKIPLIIICLLALSAGVFMSVKPGGQDTQSMVSVQEALKTSLALPLDFKKIPDFTLMDVNAEPITQAVFEDRWSIIFFGYTHCPDVCPVTLQVMKNVASKLAEQNQEPPQIVFVSVDPMRDTSEIMKNYISYFDEEFIGITGELTSVHAMTSALGIVASFTANDADPDNYIVDHTASLLLIDPQKRMRAKISPPHEAETIVADYITILGAPS